MSHSFHNLLSAAGLGMYFSHVLEEMALNKIRFTKAIFTFITPYIREKKSKKE